MRAAPTLTADSAAAIVTATVTAEQESVTLIAVTVEVSATNTRAAATAGYRTLAYDVQQTLAGEKITLFEGVISFTGDVTK